MNLKKILLTVLFLICTFFLFGENLSNPWDVVDMLEQRLESLDDYQCRMYEWSRKGRKEEIRYINFYFKKPRLIRMDIIQGNRSGDNGSIGVLKPDGRVQGRKGGILSPFVIHVDKYSALATTIRGGPFDRSDAIAAWERLIELKNTSRLQFSVEEDGWLFDFTLYEPDGEITREILFLSAENFMPLFTESYEGSELVQKVEWRSYLINTGLTDDFFDVRTEAEILNETGIPNNINLQLELRE